MNSRKETKTGKYEKPKIEKEEKVDIKQLVAGCGMARGNIPGCRHDIHKTPSG